jgi:putative membrane-bound dehydrogenase-like protein
MKIRFHVFIVAFLLGITMISGINAQSRKIEILFLGHQSEHHPSARYMPILASSLATEGINLTYTDDPNDLNPQRLSHFDGLMIYANHEQITPAQEKALLDFVREGKGFIPVHCASFCFQNSPAYIQLVGGQFERHDTGTFTATIIQKDHPVTRTLPEFATWDETYIHTKLSNDRTVLMERVEGNHREPWTWVKEYGKGRVFYTAYGHDERTWQNPGFLQLIRQGILWAVGDRVLSQWTAYRQHMPTLTYVDKDNIPNYEKRVPAPRYQEPLSPEASKQLIQVPPGFELQLFASEPDIINPIAMEWDEKGRLWVIETVDYPNSVRDDKGRGDDRIKICEDTDGDGKADKFTIFADNLNIPTSLTFYNGGVIVSQAPHFLFLKDTDGDGKADVRKVMISGWGTFDTHAGPSNLKYGIDNYIWGSVGYSGFKGTIAGVNREFSQGLYRFKPDVSEFEFLTSTSNNTWGLGFTEQHDVFASTANNTHSVFMGIPDKALKETGKKVNGSAKIDGHYAMHPITRHVRQVDVFGGFTAATGHNFYTARQYPQSYWNKVAFVCEPTGHLVHIAQIEKKGAGFVEKDGWNLLASADEWVSPVEAKTGPDGAVWILDWYNFIVQHNPTPTPERGGYAAQTGKGNAYENPLRDKTHGRIWRVVSKEGKTSPRLQLDKNNLTGLIKALGNDNLFWRTTAQRLLVERKQISVLPALYALVKDKTVDEEGNNFAALHALWTIEGIAPAAKNVTTKNIATAALKHPSPAVRKAAIQLLAASSLQASTLLSTGILQDPDPNTRLAAIVSLTNVAPSAAIGKVLVNMHEEKEIQEDEWLEKAVTAAMARHGDGEKVVVNTNVSTDVAKGGANVAVKVKVPATVIMLKVKKNEMKYDRKTFTVTAGKPIVIVFDNPDFMQHNLVITQPGAMEVVGRAADKLAAHPKGAEMSYVPEMPEVLFATKLVDPQHKVTLRFTAPTKPGDYPFVCTFPGHWSIMNGIMKVVAAE